VVYLREERGVAETTVAAYLRMIHPFVVAYFGDGSRGPAKLDAAGVIRFVLRQASGVSVCYAKLRVTVVRSFLRFAYLQGTTAVDLGLRYPPFRTGD
jgi:integrase/recombinase XerD